MISSKSFLGRLLLSISLASPFSGVLGQQCPPEPPIPDVGVPLISSEEQVALDDFGAALGRFREMSLEEFYVEYGPDRDYLSAETPRFVRGDATGDDKVGIGDAICALQHLFGGGGACLASPLAARRVSISMTTAACR